MAEFEGRERRQSALTEDKVALMIEQAVQAALKRHEQDLMLHMDKQFEFLRRVFADAFPSGDPHGHRIAHEKSIAKAGWWDKIKSDAFAKVASAGLWAIVVFLAIAAWENIKQEAKK